MPLKTKYQGPWTEVERDPFPLKTGEWRYQRPITKVGKCARCGLCYLFCPTGCVIDRGTFFTPNLDYCKGCGICARMCPVSAIRMVRESEWQKSPAR